MQQRISSTTGQETVSDDLDQKPSSKKDTLGINQFYFWPKEDQLKAFWAWLPRELADISGIDWTTISSEAMGYCVRTVRDSPDTATLAIVVASLQGLPGSSSLPDTFATSAW